MKLRRIITALCMLASQGLTGCSMATDPNLVLHGDIRFTPRERVCITYASAKWAEQTNNVANAELVWDYDPSSEASELEHLKDYKAVRHVSTDQDTVNHDRWVKQLCVMNHDAASDVCGGLSTLGWAGSYKDVPPAKVNLVMDRLSDDTVCRKAAMHELGHFFGLDHIKNSSQNVMYPHVNETQDECLKPEDLLAFCLVNDCRSRTMNPCPYRVVAPELVQ
jgi:hypothetical protein